MALTGKEKDDIAQQVVTQLDDGAWSKFVKSELPSIVDEIIDRLTNTDHSVSYLNQDRLIKQTIGQDRYDDSLANPREFWAVVNSTLKSYAKERHGSKTELRDQLLALLGWNT